MALWKSNKKLLANRKADNAIRTTGKLSLHFVDNCVKKNKMRHWLSGIFVGLLIASGAGLAQNFTSLEERFGRLEQERAVQGNVLERLVRTTEKLEEAVQEIKIEQAKQSNLLYAALGILAVICGPFLAHLGRSFVKNYRDTPPAS